ncbi:MAG: BMC domain-containing protein [Proteobacteria bacterium]|nr:BMC domain-containing protein [Pseudomonadota bacterium]
MRRPDPPAIALLEFSSIARALRTGDAMVKRADVSVLLAEPISPGKYLILITGGEAEVDESWRAGLADGADAVVDSLFLPGVHADVLDAIGGASSKRGKEHSLAVVETSTVAAAIVAADAAIKEAPCELTQLRLGKGIGGKGVFTLAGELWDVQASLAAATTAIEERGATVGTEIVARPDPRFEGGL